ncbi:AAA family ATPase [Pseudanabaena sp. SR411]|uniref:AAA family ATPase n=1 Tax=Pseudanabaena sp. SR411 TaxID=1980935 RepID=UPI00114038F2|nr:AAA family ATPase [Pseudanabaena sp. SR411]
MLVNIPKYQVIEKIYESSNSQVYRGIRQQDNLPVILKVLNTEFPTSQVIGRYKLEYEITRRLASNLVIHAHDLQRYQNGWAIVLEDFGGKSLAALLAQKKLSLVEFLNLAIQICEGVSEVHAANIIHKDLNPSNIVINLETQQLKIIDFGIASDLTKETLILNHNQVIEGTLDYISPEQTGRMNRSLDYRTDIYAMGATFYQMLTERLPFESNDPLELMHYHLALEPIAPYLINPQIPLALSQIILKLLAKTAEERYQSAWGVKTDLEECLDQLQSKGAIELFTLAEQDIADHFLISEKMYGRSHEVDSLLAAFARISSTEATNSQGDRVEMILVSGYSGIGKSTLVQEIHKPIAKSRGYFISGKFEQYQRNIPYLAIVQAFQGLIKQLLTESVESVEQWRSQISVALGANSQMITQVIPSLEMIIGKQTDKSLSSNTYTNISASEVQNRFNRVFQKLICVFAQLEHPLVMFLDDLQWADHASLRLLEILATTNEAQSLLLIGAYRDNEVNSTHPVMQMIEKIQQEDGAVNQLYLTALNLTDINQLIADTLHCSITDSLPLAELVQQKTGGNPFFMNEFLKSLHSENLLKFDYQSRQWQWLIEQIQEQGITDNIVSLMAGKIQKLSDRTQQLLQIAACIGNQFDLDTLVLASERSPMETIQALRESISEGLIRPLNSAHQSIHYGIELTNEHPAIAYRFVHDRIQQAAHSLISEVNQAVIHQRIGQQLLRNTSSEELESKVFDIVDQLNLSLGLISSQRDRDQLAQLNLLAAQKAKAATAYSNALNYVKTGVELLAIASWQNQYELSLDLYQLAVEVAFLNGDFEQMQDWANIITSHGKTILDKIKVYEIQIQALVAQNHRLEAIAMGIDTLSLLEIALPKQPSQADLRIALQDFQEFLTLHPVESLLERPLMTDPIAIASVNILLSIAAAAYGAAPELYILIVLQLVRLSITKGNAIGSAYGYSACGLILCGLMNQMGLGYQFGQLALQLLDRFESQELTAKTLVIVNVFITHWKYHLQETLQPLLNAYIIGIETGDFEFGAYGLCLHSQYLYFMGRELNSLVQEISGYETLISQLKQQTTLNWLYIYHQNILNLLGRVADPCHLVGEVYNIDMMLPIHIEKGDRIAIHMLYFHQLVLCYLFENYHLAIDHAAQVKLYEDAAIGVRSYSGLYFYESLANLAVYANLAIADQDKTMAKIEANLQRIQFWADHAPMNYRHQQHLIEAERYRVLGQVLTAMDFYDLAIAEASENGYIQDQALANELAAKFYLDQNRLTIAKAYMREARYHYLQWGALAKVQHLENRYPILLENRLADKSPRKSLQKSSISTQSSSNSLHTIDLESVIKSSQAIASEIKLDRLLSTLMCILIENAGAQTGYLLLSQNLSNSLNSSDPALMMGGASPSLKQEQWLIEAVKTINHDQVVVMQSIPIDTVSIDGNFYVPISLVHYVARTQESVVLHNACQSGDFQHDPWIVQYQSKSLLCMPLINQGRLTAIVLLENSLVTDAFTPDRIEILNLLSAQAAISIVKARLLQQQEELNQSLQVEISERQLAEEERDRLIAIIQASTDIIGMSLPQGKVIWNNIQANKVQGLPPEADISQLTIPNYHPQWALEIIQNQGIPTAVQQGTWVGETALLTHEGLEIPVSQMIIAHKSAQGDLEYISTIMRDISEAKEREAALKRSEKTLQNLVAGTAAVTGKDFFPALVRHIAEALHVKYALVTELIGEELHSLAFWSDGAMQPKVSYLPARTPCELALEHGEFVCHSLVQQLFPEDLALGVMQANSYMGIALKDDAGSSIGNLCILDVQPLQEMERARNILQVFAARASAELQRKAANEALYQLNQSLESRVNQRTAQLEAANKELESFSYSVSHDLRAPLRAIDGFSRILQEDYRDRLDGEGNRYLKIVRDNAKRMGELIDDLLNLSRWNRKELSRRSILVNNLIQQIVGDFQPEIQERQIELVIANLPNCESDNSLLTQVWINLISNAIKYTGKTENARIEIGCQIIDEQTVYFIRDNGAGFDMQYADKLFGVFQRMHLEKDFEGTGIGLAIAQRIIQRHGGKIWAEAKVNQGATFYFTIPDQSSNPL